MSVFNPDQGTANPQDFTGRSQGIPTNRAFEALFDGLGQTVTAAAVGVDKRVQKNIRDDVEASFNELNNVYGYDEATGFGTAPNSTAVPPEFDDAKDRFARMTEARAQGKLSESHYWSMLTKQAKEMRAKYPGYQDQIDAIFQDVTGATPGLALRSSLQQEYDTALREGSSKTDKLEQWLFSNSDIVTRAYPDFFENRAKYAGMESKVMGDAAKLEAQDSAFRSDNLRLENRMKNKEDVRGEAKEVYTRRANEIIRQSLDASLNVAGFDGTNFIQRAIDAQQNGKVDNKLIEDMKTQVLALKTNVNQKLLELRSNEWASSLSAEDIAAADKSAMAQIEFLEKAITDENFGLAAWQANAVKILGDSNERFLLQNVEPAAVAKALSKISPEIATEYIFKQPGGPAGVLAAARPGHVLGAISGQLTFKEIIDQTESSKMSPKQKSDYFTDVMGDLKSVFQNPNASDQNIKDIVAKNFGGENPGIREVFNKVADEDKLSLYNFWTDATVVDRIAKTGDPKLLEAYAAWAYDQFDNVPEVASTLGTLSGYANSPFDIKYDPKAKALVAVPKKNPTPGTLEESNQKSILARLNARLATVNVGMKNMIYAQEKAGADVTPLIENMIQLNNIGSTEVPEGGEGTSPFDSPPTEGDQRSSLETFDGVFNLANATINAPSTLLDFIGNLEAPQGYNQVYGSNNILPLDSMTLDQVLEFQREFVREGSPSSATGRYQFIRSTLAGLKEELGLTGTELFTAELQDQLANALLERRGYSKYKEGKITKEEFQNNLAQEWASLPTTSGTSYYDGDGLNKALTTNEAFQALLDSI